MSAAARIGFQSEDGGLKRADVGLSVGWKRSGRRCWRTESFVELVNRYSGCTCGRPGEHRRIARLDAGRVRLKVDDLERRDFVQIYLCATGLVGHFRHHDGG